jgi:hypothetical protein
MVFVIYFGARYLWHGFVLKKIFALLRILVSRPEGRLRGNIRPDRKN